MRLIDYFDKGLALAPDAPCLAWDDQTISYRDADSTIDHVARRLVGELGQQPSGVAVLSPNDPTSFLCVLGTTRAEKVWVPVNARATVAETIEVLRIAECRLLFLHSMFLPALAEIRDALPGLVRIVLVGAPTQDGAPSLEEWLTGDSGELPTPSVDPHRVAVLGFTGGTTGTPKGVQLTDLNFETMTATVLATVQFQQRPIYLAAAPLTHAAGALAFPVLGQGGTIVVLGAPSPTAIFAAIQQHRVDTMFLPPTVIYMLLDAADRGEYDLTSLRHFLYAAAPISPTRLVEAMDAFGPIMVQMFGQTEAPMICTALSAAEHVTARETGATHRFSSCGRPTAFTRLAILDDDGQEVAHGERGEVCVRGNLVMAGYYQDEAATAASRHGAWHRTGDIGYLDEDGFLYLVDRSKDVIISGGFNVYSAEVERVVSAHPAVADCVVVGSPDDHWGEVVTAVVELRPGHELTEEAVIEHCRAQLSGVKTPKRVVIGQTLPRNSVGKVLKREVRDQFWSGHERSI